MVTISKGETDDTTGSECCMCGDYGLSNELFQCHICSFRWQHRYCSNLYPKAESYRVCNWCLTRSDSTDPPALASALNSSSSPLALHGNDALGIKSTVKKSRFSRITERSGDQDLVVNDSGPDPKKRVRTPSPPPCGFRKRIITRGALEERLRRRRIKSEEVIDSNTPSENNHSKGIITKQVFRNKVRRYKLLDEVSS